MRKKNSSSGSFRFLGGSIYRFLFVLLGLLIVHGEQPLVAEEPTSIFKDGDRWAVVGDSITQGGTYYAWIYLYYATRFPEMNLSVLNAGISGDSSSGALRRYEWDIQPKKATVATVMFGMNDVNRSLYGETPDTAENIEKRESSLTNYKHSIDELVRRLKADGARVVFLTPSIYEEKAELNVPPLTGVNGALGKCAEIMRLLAAEIGATVIDVHGPMTELDARLQVNDPKFTLTSPDRVHPWGPGHFTMAYFFLKGQNAPAVVSRVGVDALSSQVTEAVNATVEKVVARGGGVEFTVKARALPYPISKDVASALAWLPFQQDLNQEILLVKGLSSGEYSVEIDGAPVRRYKAEELAAGVNLALERNTPQMRQAESVLDLVQQWQKVVSEKERSVAQVEHWQLKDLPHPVSLEAGKSILDRDLERLKGSSVSMDQYNCGVIERYLKTKPEEVQTQVRLQELVGQIHKAARPQAHTYRVTPGF